MKFLEEATLKNPVFQIVVLAKASVTRSFIFWGFFTKLFFIHPFPPCLYFPSLCCLTSVKSCTVAIFHLTLCQNDTPALLSFITSWFALQTLKCLHGLKTHPHFYLTPCSLSHSVLNPMNYSPLVFSLTKLFSLFLWNFNVNLNSSCCQIS